MVNVFFLQSLLKSSPWFVDKWFWVFSTLVLEFESDNFKLILTMENWYLPRTIMQVYKNVILQNEYQSSKLCEALYTKCEDMMDQLQVLRLPSMAKFNAGLLKCNHSFEHDCVGPSKTNYGQRMMKVCSVLIAVFCQFLFCHFVILWCVIFVISSLVLHFTSALEFMGLSAVQRNYFCFLFYPSISTLQLYT